MKKTMTKMTPEERFFWKHAGYNFDPKTETKAGTVTEGITMRVKHTREELKALRLLGNAWEYLNLQAQTALYPEAMDILLAAEMALRYVYPSDRDRTFHDHLSAFRSMRKPAPTSGSVEAELR